MMRKQRIGRRYLAGLAMAFALVFFLAGTLGPASHSPYYFLIVPPPALAALFLGWRAWWSEKRSIAFSASALALLLVVLIFSHLLPRAAA